MNTHSATHGGAAMHGVAAVGELFGDPARAAILVALLDGRARTAGELALAGNISAQSASGHLSKLTTGGLLVVRSQGRHRYYALANADVAHALEATGSLATSRAYGGANGGAANSREAIRRRANGKVGYSHGTVLLRPFGRRRRGRPDAANGIVGSDSRLRRVGVRVGKGRREFFREAGCRYRSRASRSTNVCAALPGLDRAEAASGRSAWSGAVFTNCGVGLGGKEARLAGCAGDAPR